VLHALDLLVLLVAAQRIGLVAVFALDRHFGTVVHQVLPYLFAGELQALGRLAVEGAVQILLAPALALDVLDHLFVGELLDLAPLVHLFLLLDLQLLYFLELSLFPPRVLGGLDFSAEDFPGFVDLFVTLLDGAGVDLHLVDLLQNGFVLRGLLELLHLRNSFGLHLVHAAVPEAHLVNQDLLQFSVHGFVREGALALRALVIISVVALLSVLGDAVRAEKGVALLALGGPDHDVHADQAL